MICYKDKTFCSSDCINKDCYQYFGEDEQNGAASWGMTLGLTEEDVPVAFTDYSGACPDYKTLKGDF